MNLEAARDELAATAAAAATTVVGIGVSGYREPPSELMLPAVIVLDPEEVNYHDTWGPADTATVYLRVVVPVSTPDETCRPLDQLLSPTAGFAGALQDHDATAWDRLSVIRKRPGPYTAYLDPHKRPVGVSADIELTLEF